MTHRIEQSENREDGPSGAQQTRVTWLLIAILGLAFGLRVWGIGFGLPYDFSVDEIHEVVRALKLGAGEYYWGFGKGGLYYILFVEYAVLYVVWWLIGWVGSPREFAVLFIQDPSAFFLAGRLTVALMGTVTCLVIFFVGRRIYDWRVGLGAAFIGATAYFHGVHSHIINVDIGMTLALWASILAYLKFEEKRERRWLVTAGALGGIAIAFKLPGAIVLLPLLLAIGSCPGSWRDFRQMLKEAGIVVVAALVTLTLVAPEWTTSIGTLYKHFVPLVEESATPKGTFEGTLKEAVHLVTIRSGTEWIGYFKILLQDYNLPLTFTALLGAGVGLFRRQRWSVIWCVLIVVFLGIMTASDWGKPERYLLPIIPALWLLSSQGIAAVSGRHWWLSTAALVCVASLSLVALVRQDYEWTKPDTRVLAKEWIEANVPSGAKILMDGMRYRFVMSPPLTPNNSTVERQVAEAAQGKRLSRGVSTRTLALYAEAMEQVKGPTYELHSTVWGLGVEDLTYYVQSCFDYIITSSHITRKYESGITQERFPKSARFYDQLYIDPRFQKVYSVEPISWQRSGPTITAYKVLQTCGLSQNGTDNSRKHPQSQVDISNSTTCGLDDDIASSTDRSDSVGK